MAVTLYRQVGKGRARRYTKVNLGPGRRPTNLAGPYFLRYSLPDGTRPWEPAGDDLDAANDAQKRKQAYFDALSANVPVVPEQGESARTKISDAICGKERRWRSEDRPGLVEEKGTRAEAIQLTVEYDPHPPFDAGHMSKACKETQKLAKQMMDERMPPDQRRLVPKIAWRRFIDLVRTGK